MFSILSRSGVCGEYYYSSLRWTFKIRTEKLCTWI